MTTATLESSIDSLRDAVAARMAATDPSDPKMQGYKIDQGDQEPAASCCEGMRAVVSRSWDNAEMAKADVSGYMAMFNEAAQAECERLRGDSLMRENAAPGSREWLDALDRLRALHHEKTAQYGGAEDAFENVTASAKCGVEPWRRALCDLSDCVVRMQKYAQGQPVDPTNALLDAANWALICLIKMEEAGRSTTGPIPIMRKVGG
jgi:hypothetical protein